MSDEKVQNELLSRLMTRDVDAARVSDMLSRLGHRGEVSDEQLLVERLMTSHVSSESILKATRMLEIAVDAEPNTAEEREDLAFEKARQSRRRAADRRAISGGTPSHSVPEQPPQLAREINAIWAVYKNSKTENDRNLLAEHYLHIVRREAEQIHRELPEEVNFDALFLAGTWALLEAIDAFEPDRGVKFETECAPRIREAILAELRSMDWVPPLIRSKMRELEDATKQLQTELGRAPTNEEVAKRLKIDTAKIREIIRINGAMKLGSLTRKWFPTPELAPDAQSQHGIQPKPEDALREIQRQDLKMIMTKSLNRTERLIVILYYFEEMTMQEIAETLELSEERVTQMHRLILTRLRAMMDARRREFAKSLELNSGAMLLPA